MKLKTLKLRKMLQQVTKCKANPALEITNYIELCFKETGLVINATDSTNFISVVDDEVKGNNESLIIKTDQFAKLIAKTTKENVELIPHNDHLEVKGNGTYKVELVEDEVYPTYEPKPIKQFILSNKQLQHGIASAMKAKSSTANEGVLYGVSLKDGLITGADSIKVSITVLKGFDSNILIPPSICNLMTALDDEKVTLSLCDNSTVLIEAGGVTIYGRLMDGAEEYPDLSGLVEDENPYSCKVDKSTILEVIDRLNLFVSTYDKNIINIVFTDSGLVVGTAGGSTETVLYVDPIEIAEDILYQLNIAFLKDLITNLDNSAINIEFGEPDLIILSSESDIMLLASSEE